jgi:hypothetical protein
LGTVGKSKAVPIFFLTLNNSVKQIHLTILSSLVSILCFGQSNTFLVGKVLNSKDNTPVPFANVYAKLSREGTVTNEEGIFRLRFPNVITGDSLIISFVGFKSFTHVFSSLSMNKFDTLQVALEEAPIALQAVEVIAATPYNFLKTACEVTNRHLVRSALVSVYYREFQSKNGYYMKFADALVDYYIEYFRGEKADILTRINESRTASKKYKSPAKSLGDIQIPEPINLETLPQFFDAERKFSLIFKDGQDYDFEIFEIRAEEEYFIIKFKPKPNVEKVLYEGEFYINKETSMIHSAAYKIADGNKKYGPQKNVLGVKFEVTDVTLYAQFQNIGDKCHLKYVKATFDIRVFNKKDYDVTNHFVSEMLVNNVTSVNSVPFAKSELYKKNSLYKRGSNYITEFWEGQKGLILTEQESKILEGFNFDVNSKDKENKKRTTKR